MEVLTFEEAAEYLRISKGTLNKLIKKGIIHNKKVGKQYRFLKTELQEYMKNDKQKRENETA